jgi:hypothetical protein
MAGEPSEGQVNVISTEIDLAVHRKLAVELFNFVWTFLDRKERTPEEADQMIHAAHASRYHWGIAGTAREWSVGEWQISRVYAVLGRAEPAIHHARRALVVAQENSIGSFFVAYGYEALARAFAAAGDDGNCRRFMDSAREAGAAITDSDERKMLHDDLATILYPP